MSSQLPQLSQPAHMPQTPQAPLTPQAAQAAEANLKREVEATLAARRELGPEYDEHFAVTLAQQMMQLARQEAQRTPAPRQHLEPGHRVAIAICSLVFAIPIIAVAGGGGGAGGLIGVIVACAAILGINVAASR